MKYTFKIIRTSCKLLYHLRNTNNQKWPLRTTLDRVEAWLKNEVDTYEAMMEHGADFSQEKIPGLVKK